jgi:hypothetical protein
MLKNFSPRGVSREVVRDKARAEGRQNFEPTISRMRGNLFAMPVICKDMDLVLETV